MKHRALLGVFMVSLLSGAATHAQTDDPRLEEARGLLADASGYERAISLFRDVVADDPAADDARQWLARVLAWESRYDESLAHYDHFAQRDEPPRWALVERAEVLSWAGRTAEAEQAFQDLLAADPDDARAARGLARVYLWSARPAQADAAYERALSLEEDPEARRELRKLRAGLDRDVALETTWFADSDDFSKLRTVARTSHQLGYRTRLVATSGWTRIHRDDSLDAFDARLEVERTFGERVKASIEAGARIWLGAPEHFVGGAAIEYAAPTQGVLTLSADHGDFLDRSGSFDAVEAGIRDTTVRLAAWQPLHPRVALFAWGEGTFLDDDNQRAAGGVSFDYSPWPERDVTASLAASYTGYAKESALYYDPDVDVAASLGVRATHPLFEALSLSAHARGGYGYARQDGVAGQGFTWYVDGGPTWRPGRGWWLSLRGSVGRSQRSSTYATHGAYLDLGKSF